MQVETNPLTKKESGKWDTVWPSGTDGIKIVFVLLAKVILFYMTFYNKGLEIILLAAILIAFSNKFFRKTNLCRVL